MQSAIPRFLILADGEETVAEVRLRRRAHADAPARRRQEVELGVVRMRSVHDCRPRAETAGLGEKLDRSKPVLGHTLFDLARLLVGVNMEHQLLALRIPADLAQPVRRARAHGVGRDTDARSLGTKLLDLRQVGGRGLLAEPLDAPATVGGQQEHKLDSRSTGGLDRRLRLGEPHIVEFTHGRVAGSAHLPEGGLVLDPNLRRGQAPGQLQHGVAPAPEVLTLSSPA